MSIYKNIRKVRALIASESVDNVVSPIGQAIDIAAKAAITHGMVLPNGTVSPEWRSYMAVFADNPEQLARLTVQDPNEKEYITSMRFYIVTSGMCDPGTNLSLPMTFDQKIDGEGDAAGNPSVPAEPNDPNNEIANFRPAALRNIR